ncbi:MAG TPA: S46 family peptidase [Polyangiaceae bacterium]|nr:S46 family peptidase [Polyangiaceae bacterium]
MAGLALLACKGIACLGIACTGIAGNQAAGAASKSPPVSSSSSKLPAATTGTRPATPAPSALDGGLWLPSQLAEQPDELRRYGFELDPQLLADPNSPLLASVVHFSGCSASFVSDLGLFVTNHHCAVRALEYNSKPEDNLLKRGFLARRANEERSAGPSARLLITRSMRDVTQEVRAELAQAPDDVTRALALEAAQKRLVASCEAGQAARRCQLASFYSGRQYFVIEREELRDLRIVYAPADGLGNFGGEVDNWRWPRHSADFAFFRAYTDAAGKPAEFSPENVPYRPAHWLKLAATGVQTGDPIWVLGFPGRTARSKLRREVQETLEFTYPHRLALFEEYIQRIEQLGASDPELLIKATSLLRAFGNYRTKNRGEIEGMQRGKLLDRKQREEQELLASLAAQPARATQLKKLLAEVDSAFDALRSTRRSDATLEFELPRVRLLAAATRIVRLAEERQRPDAERDPEYQERNVSTLRDEIRSHLRSYYAPLDQALLGLAMQRLSRDAGPAQPLLDVIVGKDHTPRAIEQAVQKLYASTRLADEKRALQLFDHATRAQLAQERDPLIALATRLRPLENAADLRRKQFTGRMLRLAPTYLELAMAAHPGRVAPDANATLRISVGHVGGGQIAGGPDASGARLPHPTNPVFTWLSEIPRKHTGKPPFEAPRGLLDAIALAKVGEPRLEPLTDRERKEVPVNFLSDASITNGSSGSPTLNSRGELVGLAFDGTYESVAADWLVDPDSRSIHVDLRYLLFVLEQVEQAQELLHELGR